MWGKRVVGNGKDFLRGNEQGEMDLQVLRKKRSAILNLHHETCLLNIRRDDRRLLHRVTRWNGLGLMRVYGCRCLYGLAHAIQYSEAPLDEQQMRRTWIVTIDLMGA